MLEKSFELSPSGRSTLLESLGQALAQRSGPSSIAAALATRPGESPATTAFGGRGLELLPRGPQGLGTAENAAGPSELHRVDARHPAGSVCAQLDLLSEDDACSSWAESFRIKHRLAPIWLFLNIV